MSEQLLTSRTVSSNTATTKPPDATPKMFTGVPSVPTSSQMLDRVHPGTILTVWFVPIFSFGTLFGISYIESHKLILRNSINLGSSVSKDQFSL